MPEVATPNQAEREFETGTDETFKANNTEKANNHAENQRITFANLKRTYDIYQDLDVQSARQSQTEIARLNNIAAQALQNSVETANLVAKRNLELNNLAHDSFWNPVAAGTGMNLTAGAVPANRVVDTAAAGVAATIPASSDVRIIATVEALAAQVAALQQMVAALANNQPTSGSGK